MRLVFIGFGEPEQPEFGSVAAFVRVESDMFGVYRESLGYVRL